MKKGLFRRIFVLYAVILTVAALFTEIYITTALRERSIEELRNSLTAQAELISESVTFSEGNLDDLSRRLKERVGARVTIIAADGTVIGDSDSNSSGMENHLNRAEIEQAGLSDIGTAIRYSATLKTDFLYLAKRKSRGDETAGFTRLSVPLSTVYRSVNTLRFKIVLVVGLALLAPAVLALWQTERLRRLLAEVRSFSRTLAKGDVGRRLFLTGAPEFVDLTNDLNTMSTKLQAMMAENEEEKKRLNVILNSIPDALLISDARGIVLLASSSAASLFGNAPLIGKGFLEIIRDPELSNVLDRVRKNIAPDVADIRLEIPVERHLVARVSPLSYRENEFSGFVAVFHDITRLRKLEDMRKDFVANASHEIKTPITAIRGFTETLLEGALDDRENACRFLEMIRANSERINNLVDDLMMISKIELGVMQVEKAPVTVSEVVETVLSTLKQKAEAKGLTLGTTFASEGVQVDADRNKLIQILTNLVDNAIKFTESGSVTVGLQEEQGMQCLFVEDTGIGIERKHLARVGERFYRIDPARSRKMGGTGLGLAIVKHLVRAHNWHMRIESTPLKGTKVIICAPDRIQGMTG